MGRDMDFRVLGQLEVLAAGKSVTVSTPKVRILLAALLLRPNRTVSADELVDRLWDTDPPRMARQTIQTYVLRLRRTIGDVQRIVTTTHGYQIEVDPTELDLHRFRALVERAGRQPNLAGESRLLGEALAQWRGAPLADVPSSVLQNMDVPVLTEERLAALERRFDIELELGHHTALLRELQAATAEFPLRERFHGHLMQALHRSGRRADAFAAYQHISDLLATHLGVDPSEELRTIRQRILTDDSGVGTPPAAGSALVPRELPPDLGDFVGRADARARMSQLLTGAVGVPLAVVVGPPGVGKTALAVKVAHELRGRFPDGQLHADMRGYSSGPELTADDVLARFLVSLGTPATLIPASPDELVALYRSTLADRQVLILLDNVTNPRQVRPILPGTPGCAVIVTSRNDLRGLTVRQGARPIGLGMLPPEQSHELLGTIIGQDIAAEYRQEMTELAELCGHLPLALRIAAGNILARHDVTLPGYLAELRANRLSALEIDDDDEAAVRATFRLSYRALEEQVARVFRLLGLVPGADCTPHAVAALAGLPVDVAGRVLDQLVAANLVARMPGRRYQVHDLLRGYAAEECASAAEMSEARARLFGFYMLTVDATRKLLFPITAQMPRPDVDPAVRPVRFVDSAEAMSWMERECLNVFDVIVAAVRHGHHEVVGPLVEASRPFVATSGRYRTAVMADGELRAGGSERVKPPGRHHDD